MLFTGYRDVVIDGKLPDLPRLLAVAVLGGEIVLSTAPGIEGSDLPASPAAVVATGEFGELA